MKTELVKFVGDANEGKSGRIPGGSPVAEELGKRITIINFGVKKQRTILRVKISAKQAYFVCYFSKNKLLANYLHVAQMRDMDGLKKQHILQLLLLCNLFTTVRFSFFFFLTGHTGCFL